VKVQMRDSLLPVLTAIEYSAVSTVQSFLGRNLLGTQKKVTHQLLVFIRQVIERRNWFARHNQNVNGCLGLDITEGDTPIVFVHHVRRNLSVSNLLEQGLIGHDSGAVT
jgi:hypothetical protein